MTAVSGEIHYSRPLPPHWNELVGFAEDLVGPADPLNYTPEASLALLDRLSQLDNESFEQHRYYSLGLFMAGVLRKLRDPGARDEAVRTSGDSLYRHWRVNGTDRESLHSSDIDGSCAGVSLYWYVTQEGKSLPPAVQLLSDALHADRSIRNDALEAQEKARQSAGPIAGLLGRLGITAWLEKRRPKQEFPRQLDQILWRDREEDGSIKHGIAAEHVAGQVATAASTVLQRVLGARHNFTAAQQERTEYEPIRPATAVEIMDEAGTAALALENVGTRCAALRIDEFRFSLSHFIDTDDDGTVVFRRDRLTPNARLRPALVLPDNIPPVSPVLHLRRQRCPAMFVEDLIPEILEFMVDAVRHADALAVEDHRRWRS